MPTLLQSANSGILTSKCLTAYLHSSIQERTALEEQNTKEQKNGCSVTLLFFKLSLGFG